MSKSNFANVILLILIAFIIAFFSFSYFFTPQKSFSENENRSLQTIPSFKFEKLLNGTYTRQLHNYFSDQVILRDEMIEIKAKVELLIGKKENNSILLGNNNYLIETHQYTNENYSFLKNNISKIENLMKIIKENEVASTSIIIPRKVDVLQDKFPMYYSDARNKEAWNVIGENHILLNQALSTKQKDGFEIFYKTDHHWTNTGAYCAYSEIAEILGFIPKGMDYLTPKTLSKDFLGTTYSKSGFFFVDSESIEAPTIEKGRYKVTIVDTGLEFDTLYDCSYLEKKDKYGVFLSGNNAHVKIYDAKDNNKETLLLIKDSFSHSLAPYLCEHYNLELIDPRYYSGSIEGYIKDNKIKNVLFLFGIETLASGNINIR